MTRSLKSLAADKTIKKDDLFKARHDQIHVKKGHNKRDFSRPAVQEHIRRMFDSLMAGEELPPILVYADSNGKIWIVDGECRWRAYGMAIKAGKEIEYIKMIAHRGDDKSRHKTMMRANEGMHLSPLEKAEGYLESLRTYNMNEQEIAQDMGVSKERVTQLLKLAEASFKIKNLVRDEKLSADLAIEEIEKYGEDAYDHIVEGLAVAAANGKSKLTRAAVVGRALPRKTTEQVLTSVYSFTTKLDNNVRIQLAGLEKVPESELDKHTVAVPARAILELLQAQNAVDVHNQKVQEKMASAEQAARQAEIAA
jgi:ParB/RepB/Spo0J family partition protein